MARFNQAEPKPKLKAVAAIVAPNITQRRRGLKRSHGGSLRTWQLITGRVGSNDRTTFRSHLSERTDRRS